MIFGEWHNKGESNRGNVKLSSVLKKSNNIIRPRRNGKFKIKEQFEAKLDTKMSTKTL